MKKTWIFILLITQGLSLCLSNPCQLNKFSLSIGAGIKNVKEDLHKEVYSDTVLVYNLEMAYMVLGTLELFLQGGFLSEDGELTLSKESTALKIMPLEIGVRYLIRLDKSCKIKLFPYIGVGAGYYFIQENNPIGKYKEEKLGFFIEGGLRFYLSRLLFVDTKIKHLSLDLKNTENESVALGGISTIVGIGISF